MRIKPRFVDGKRRSKEQLRAKERTSNKRASFTRIDLSIILAEIICFVIAKNSRIGLLRLVNELQVSPGLSLIGQV
jgi:hypothetical protein